MGKHASKEELDRAFEKGERDGSAGVHRNPSAGWTTRQTEINEAYRSGNKKGRRDDD